MSTSTTHYQRMLKLHLAPEHYPMLFDYLLSHGRVVRHAADVQFLQQDSPIDYIGLLLSGSAEAYTLDEQGQQVLVAERGPGGWYGLMEFLDGHTLPLSSRTLSEVLELRIPHRALRAAEAPKAEVFELVARQLAVNLRLAHRVFAMHKNPDIDERLHACLRELADASGNVTTTHDKLAAYLDISRFKVQRMLKKLEQQGMVECHYRRIRLLQ
ncbi:Crp/Fnr family transcriptional regulator [Ferrimonas marina]|uniref:cAMP-binding domain of CRP or a regulatory subunit of cAMP-dependent protein kinases n=1 Tax=Ferrimonas marina TaxID=299255 RepID=A0A1M5YT51_9GAMM|nr:Crp/Fnr family transcriptional regulator [Ferrimonas marina]SHI15252.1 cAMP-binding domain of CRP or a regulatory subunit of cAMP-dependent protein kinases [Ferrimonas marina]